MNETKFSSKFQVCWRDIEQVPIRGEESCREKTAPTLGPNRQPREENKKMNAFHN
jgi:hypothetical protein